MSEERTPSYFFWLGEQAERVSEVWPYNIVQPGEAMPERLRERILLDVLNETRFGSPPASAEALLRAEEGTALELMSEKDTRIMRLRIALARMVNHYVALVDSGDAGSWNPEEEAVVIMARRELADAE